MTTTGEAIELGADAPVGGVPPAPTEGRVASRPSVWGIFLRKPSTLIFLPLLLIFVIVSVVGPYFVGSPVSTGNPPLLPPSGEFPLGTDALGRDYLARVVYGGQISLLVGFSVAVLCMTIGIIVGGLAGYYGGFIDTALVKVAEFFQVLPGLILALVAAALLGSNIVIIVAILAITMWPSGARIVRAEAMRISKLGYVESAKAAGFGGIRILWSDVIPNAMPPVLVATSMTVGRAILVESGLAYLGIGDTNRPSWGALLNSAQPYMQQAWWLALFPGMCIFLVVLAVNILGDGLNDALNPTIGRVK
ncbi:Binding-protein-dependent transport system inner membrane protein [Microbacterium sp. C448]|uniref:ABC transporter permease n=1 Tax=Microbacterium TaxID=33882 RepID=UPI0003DE6359|nr:MULTISPECIES: ABC transporter permease [Microbacterium]MDO8384726.1 ABC transporter permease [Microbacterium sp.]CDJ99500.1 Binding-protein-dependent transport system inner membrane protein [Microbacterium sp. C448]